MVLGEVLGCGEGDAVGTGLGVGPPPAGPIIAGIPPFVLHAETAAHSAAAATSVKSERSTRFMAQGGYTWSIRASPARVECLGHAAESRTRSRANRRRAR